MRPRVITLALLAAVALAAAGCGVGPGAKAGSTSLTITQGFGADAMTQLEDPRTGGSDTYLRLLERNARITTRYGGGFVQSIDGRAGGTQGGRPYDWFYYVNGVEATVGATQARVHAGDAVWWDRHDWGAAQDVPAVVGSFPEPFAHGLDGKRLPTRVECEDPAGKDCDGVLAVLTKLDIAAAQGALAGSQQTENTLRILVGRYSVVRQDHAGALLAGGPKASGVYVRPSADGRRLAILDGEGRTVRTLGPGTGLVAAVRFEDERPVWLVTGTDEAGVRAAVGALDEGDLKNHFALAISDGEAVPVPAPTPASR